MSRIARTIDGRHRRVAEVPNTGRKVVAHGGPMRNGGTDQINGTTSPMVVSIKIIDDFIVFHSISPSRGSYPRQQHRVVNTHTGSMEGQKKAWRGTPSLGSVYARNHLRTSTQRRR